jgi:hypothetical protein
MSLFTYVRQLTHVFICVLAMIAGFPETNVLGCIEGLRDWHGLSGYLRPTAWWEKERTQFHHDGAFSASSPPPPAFVAM